MSIIKLTTIALTIAVMAAPLLGAPEPEPTTRPASTQPDMTPRVSANSVVARDVPYVANASEKQTLDVYAPRDAKDAPIIVFIHGGEWTKGDKSEISFKPKFFNETGVIFIAANYRLSGTDKHPAQANDVASAVRWAKDHAAEYGGNPHKIVLMGHSAGCHLVTLVGLDPRWLAQVGMKPSDLAAVVSWSGGAFDLVDKVKSGGMYPQYIRANFGEDESAWRDASPINHVRDSKQLPPFLSREARAQV